MVDNVVLIGGSGFIGTALAENLARRNIKFTVLARSLVKHSDVTLAVKQPGGVPLFPLPWVSVETVCFRRAVAPLSNIAPLLKLIRLFRRHMFYLVHSFAPKAGVLGVLAGRMAGMPMRLHIFTGQVWVTVRGLSRQLFRNADKITAHFTTHLFPDSASQRHFLIDKKIVPARKIRVLASGSVNGVNLERFKPDPERLGEGMMLIAKDNAEYSLQARQMAVQRFDMDHWIKRHRMVFNRLLELDVA